jgi:cytochrome c553
MMKLIFATLILLFLVSCGDYVEFKEEPLPLLQGRFSVTELTFDNISKSIIKNNCLQCHPSYSDYDYVLGKSNEILDAVLSERMPKNAPGLSLELKSLLSEWVKKGSPLGRELGPGDEVLELKPNWNSISKKVIFPKCVRCHNPEGQASFLDLSSRQSFYEQRNYLLNGLQDVENSYLFEVLNDSEEPMPPLSSGLERLSEKEMEVLKEWIVKGLP